MKGRYRPAHDSVLYKRCLHPPLTITGMIDQYPLRLVQDQASLYWAGPAPTSISIPPSRPKAGDTYSSNGQMYTWTGNGWMRFSPGSGSWTYAGATRDISWQSLSSAASDVSALRRVATNPAVPTEAELQEADRKAVTERLDVSAQPESSSTVSAFFQSLRRKKGITE